MDNRSVPTDTFLSHLVYNEVGAAITWLTANLGFTEHYRYGPPDHPQGAQLRRGSGVIMLTSAQAGRKGSPAEFGAWTQSITIFVDDVDAIYARLQASGARITEELGNQMYGERQFSVSDPEGHQWIFSQHIADVDPASWGARLAVGTARREVGLSFGIE